MKKEKLKEKEKEKNQKKVDIQAPARKRGRPRKAPAEENNEDSLENVFSSVRKKRNLCFLWINASPTREIYVRLWIIQQIRHSTLEAVFSVKSYISIIE